MSNITVKDITPADDLLRELRPQKGKQEDFVRIPDDIFEALFGGAAFGGKSFILTTLPLIKGWYKYRGFKGIILRRKFPDLEREIIRLSKEYYPATGGTYNEQKHVWEWREYGSYLDFGHVQHSDDIKMYDSAQYNYCAFDELTHFEEAPYRYMVGSRVRPGSASINVAVVRNGTNPGGVGQTFVYNRFVKPCEDGYKRIVDSVTGLSRIFIPARAEDNPIGQKYDPDYTNKLEIMPEAEKRAKKYGDWHAFEGSVFPQFRPIRFPGEPDNALHVIDPFIIPEWWPKILVIDWGKRAMCYATWSAISPDGRVYIYKEREWFGQDIPIWGSEVRELSEGENIVQFTLCGSAWQDRGNGTIAAQVQQYVGIAPTSSKNTPGSRVATLQLAQDFLRWEKKKSLAAKGEFFDIEVSAEIFRKHGAEAQARYRQQFLDEEDESNLPKILMFSNCKRLIETIPIAIYDDDNSEDIAEFSGDDPLDNFRYICKTAAAFIADPKALEKQAAIQAAVEEVERDMDMTRFYRRMEHLERNTPLIRSRGPHTPVRRMPMSRRKGFYGGRH